MLLTPQNSALVTLFGLVDWFTMHQGSYCTYYMTGRFGRITTLKHFSSYLCKLQYFLHWDS